MSIVEARNAIVSALRTVPDLDVHEFTPETIGWNSTWVSWQETTILNDCHFEHDFVIVYVPPQSNYKETFSNIDKYTVLISDALYGVGPLQGIEPQVFQMGQPGVSQVWGVEFTISVTVKTGE